MVKDNRIKNILNAVKDAQSLLNEHMTSELEVLMNEEQKAKLHEARTMVGVDLVKASKELERINEKYKRDAKSNS